MTLEVYPPTEEHPAWTVAQNDVWVAGVYTSEHAARYAPRFTDAQLRTLPFPASYEDLVELRNKLNEEKKATPPVPAG